PRRAGEAADLLIISFGVNDTLAYRSPSTFAGDLAALVTAARARIGDAVVVITGVAPLACFPALPWPLRTILNWRSVALQEAAEGLAARFPRLIVERFAEPFGPHLFAVDGFHPNIGGALALGRGDRVPGTAAVGRPQSASGHAASGRKSH